MQVVDRRSCNYTPELIQPRLPALLTFIVHVHSRQRNICEQKIFNVTLRAGFIAAEYRDNILDRDDEETIVSFEINWDRVLWVKKYPVVLGDWIIVVAIDLSGDRDDASCDSGDLDLVWKMDTRFGLLFVVVFSDQHALTDWLDNFEFATTCAL